MNKNLTKKTTPNFAYITFSSQNYRGLSKYLASLKKGKKLIYQSCCEEIYIARFNINNGTVCVLQILIITHTDRDMSHFLRLCIFQLGPVHGWSWLSTTDLKAGFPFPIFFVVHEIFARENIVHSLLPV